MMEFHVADIVSFSPKVEYSRIGFYRETERDLKNEITTRLPVCSLYTTMD